MSGINRVPSAQSNLGKRKVKPRALKKMRAASVSRIDRRDNALLA
jgi:hypothetical protein